MSDYNRDKHHRRSIRLREYDYARPGAYFVTICARERTCLLGDVTKGVMILNSYGQVVESCWQALPLHFSHVQGDAFVIMPNHVHGIIVLRRGEAFAANASPLQGTKSGSLGAIVQNFKSVTTRRINQMRGMLGTPFWQRNYYEHIIRNEDEWNEIRRDRRAHV